MTKVIGCLLMLLLLGACAEGSSAGPQSSEPPFYVADRNADGPLTLAEMQINIPKEVDVHLNDKARACFFAAVERRAQEAGDPADIDPLALPYWDGKVSQEDWDDTDKHMQRVLLAQGLISFAMSDC